MDIIQLVWLLILFLLSLTAYLGFSVVSYEAIASFTLPPGSKKEEYRLTPLTTLSPEPRGLLTLVNFSRLLFAIPVLVIVYHWGSRAGAAIGIGTVIASLIFLYLIPFALLRRKLLNVFRPIVQVLSYILYPLFWLMSKPAPPKVEPAVPEEEKGQEAEAEEEESEEFKGDILQAISTIEETTVREVMTPRVDMVCVPSTVTLAELHQQFKEHKFSRMPVFREKIDNIVGLVSVMDLIDSFPNYDQAAHVSDIMRPVVFVPESKKVFTLLREFRESHTQMAVVIDEYGGISGLVSFEDLLEEIVGEIEDEYDEAQTEMIPEKDGAYIVAGKFPVERLEELFRMKVAEDDFETVSGLIFSVVGRIPLVGETIQYKNLQLEILEADKRRIHRIRIKELPHEREDAEEVI